MTPARPVGFPVRGCYNTPKAPRTRALRMTADRWFQTLFADRIGGAAYGKGCGTIPIVRRAFP